MPKPRQPEVEPALTDEQIVDVFKTLRLPTEPPPAPVVQQATTSSRTGSWATPRRSPLTETTKHAAVPNWNELLQQLQRAGSAHDVIRRHYLAELSRRTGRNTIVYYSAWLQKPQVYDQQPEPFTVNDQDTNGFMATIHKHGSHKGTGPLPAHTGGDLAATESLVTYSARCLATTYARSSRS